jgi:Protein kinase domain/WD40-like Beta Propeller Repeat
MKALAPGDTLLQYRITAALGAGGMGEVYRATDTRLGRDVAIKVLPSELAGDPDRLARFEREGKLLAALNHTGIAHLYGFESVARGDGPPSHLLVMELVEGEELAERMKRGPIPVDEAIAIARQIAEALEAAHEKGIVHRDLKPANVKLGADGRVKVLDFGLAKAWSGEPAASGGTGELSRSPTLARSSTEAGLILGTAAYMSPEQARGKAIDKRADIWAFGVVVFEMLTGRKLFEGETVTDVLAAVVRQEIDWQALPPATPSLLRRLLRSCLERDPRQRLHDAADARIVLDELLRGPSAEERASEMPASRQRPGWRLAAALALGALLGGAAAYLARRPASPAPAERWLLALPEGLALNAVSQPALALSRDGRLQVAGVVSESGAAQLLLRDSLELEPRLLPDTEGATSPFFSPDGAWVGFFRRGGLYKLPLAGGPPVRLAEATAQDRGATWGTDGFVYFAPDTVVGLSRVPEGGGAVEVVTRLDASRDERTHRWPQALDDGTVLFTCDTAVSTEYYDDARIETVRPATGERKVLIENASMARHAGGPLVFARGGSLFAVAFDSRRLTVNGSPAKVLDGVATDVSSGAVQFALAPSGALLWAAGRSQGHFDLVWVDRKGTETKSGIPPGAYNELALSPDATRIALVGGEGGGADLWVADIERGVLSRLTTGESIQRPVFSPDGSRVAYGTRPQDAHGNHWQVAWKPADGSRPAEILVDGVRNRVPTSFTPDGRHLVYDAFQAAGLGRDVFLLPLAGPREPRLLVSGPFAIFGASVSPDGRWLAYASDESGLLVVYVRPFPEGEGRYQVSPGFGTEPRWSRDGRELFYRSGNVLYAVTIEPGPKFKAGRPERLFDRVATGALVSTYGLAPDGTRFFTFREPEGQGGSRSLALDLGFLRRLEAGASPPR